MKVYNKVVIDIKTGTVIEEHYEDYDGPVAHCGGGGGGHQTVTHEGEIDKEYNRRMARVAEEEMAMKEGMYDFFQQHQQPVEQAKLEANKELIPYQTSLQKEKTEVGKDTLEMQQGILDDLGPELDINSQMNTAEADVAQQFDQNLESNKREMSRHGISPASGKFQSMQSDFSLNKAAEEAGARNKARQKAKQTGFGLLSS